ncbi:LamG domain-containing protein [Paenibacillus sp. FSL K6-2524]|uniref:LamG domain-containing protein n=1 Tax=Paenibacillus sp. FSL K6-2524 TaxID=2954516 RepID=UPI0030FC0B95
MSLLISLSLYFLYKVLDKLIINKVFSVIAFSFVLFYGYVHFKLVNPDPYFQYFPIRTLFPTLIIYGSLKYFENKSSLRYYLVTLLSCISVLWNLDTGLIVFLTWILVQIFDECFNWKDGLLFVRKSLIHILVSISALIVVLVLFLFYIYFRSGTIPNLFEFFNYQIYFYGYGFFMLPMDLIHPWNLVVLVYIIGLVVSLNAVLKKENTLLVRMIFLLSILGVGLLSYYQGRSHNHVLTLVWYPALMLLVIFVYMLYCKVEKKIVKGENKNWLQICVLLTLILFMASSIFSLSKGSITIYQLLENRWSSTYGKKETPITSGIDFIRENTKEGEETLILSYHSGVDYLYSKTTAQINIPGMSEIFLNKEYDKINEAIVNSSLQKIFLDKNFLSNVQQNYKANIKVISLLFDNFKIVSTSDYNNVLMLSRKSDNLPFKNTTLLPNSKSKQHYVFYNDLFAVDSISNQFVGFKEYLPSIDLDQKFSIEVLLNPNKTQSPYASIIGNHPGNGFQGFVIHQEIDNPNVYSFNYGDGLQWSSPLSFPLEPGEWNYLAVVFNIGSVKIFKNGQFIEEANDSILDHFKNSEIPLSIGNWAGNDREFNGTIREVKISDGILSDQDILDNWKGMLEHLLD